MIIIEAIAVRIQGIDYRTWSIQSDKHNICSEGGTYIEALQDFVSLCQKHFGYGSIRIIEVRLQNWTPYDSEKIDMVALQNEHRQFIADIIADSNSELESRNENAGVYAFEYDMEEMDRIARNTVNGYE